MTIQDFQDRLCGYRPTLQQARAEFAVLVPIDWLRTHPPEVYRYRLDPVGIESFPYDAVGVPADYRWQCAQMEVPVYRGLPHPLWGLTARITDWLVQRFCAEPTP